MQKLQIFHHLEQNSSCRNICDEICFEIIAQIFSLFRWKLEVALHITWLTSFASHQKKHVINNYFCKTYNLFKTRFFIFFHLVQFFHFYYYNTNIFIISDLLTSSSRYTNADLKISLYVRIHLKSYLQNFAFFILINLALFKFVFFLKIRPIYFLWSK